MQLRPVIFFPNSFQSLTQKIETHLVFNSVLAYLWLKFYPSVLFYIEHFYLLKIIVVCYKVTPGPVFTNMDQAERKISSRSDQDQEKWFS